MKKFLLALVVLGGVTFNSFAQSDNAVTFGIKGGVNFANMTVSSSESSATASFGSLTTFHAGVFADFKTGDAISIQPGLYYTGLGFKTTATVEDVNVSVKNNLYYLQLPVNVVYNAPLSFGKFFVGAGPFVGYGLSGKSKASAQGQSESNDIEFGDDGDFKKTNFGVTGLAGIQLESGLLFNINYDLGLSNVASNSGSTSVKTRVFGISVGYAF